MAAVVALAAVVVILANDEDQVSGGTASARPIESINYGGFNSATGRPAAAPVVQQQAQSPGTRYDGGPEEGAPAEQLRSSRRRRPARATTAAPKRAPAGPQQLQFKERAGGPTMIPQGPGAR